MRAGCYSYVHTPIEAFPDVTNTQIIIVSQWPGRSAEEVERFVTVPIEVAMNSVQKKSNMRSISMFGLSVLKINFDDDVDDFYARQQVNNLLAGVSLPDDCDNHVQPPYGPTGEIFRYTVQGKGRNHQRAADPAGLGGGAGPEKPCPAWPTLPPSGAPRRSTKSPPTPPAAGLQPHAAGGISGRAAQQHQRGRRRD